FDPLTLEDVLGVIEVEQPEGVIVQFGGQTPLKLAGGLVQACVRIRGALLAELGLHGPAYATANSTDEALDAAADVGYPLLVRPSYVLGGRAMEICYSRDQLADYL